MAVKLSSRQRMVFSLATIVVAISIVLLMPRYSKAPEQVVPDYGVRRVAAPTPTPAPAKIVDAVSQPPGASIKINSVNSKVPIYINVKYGDSVIGNSSLISKATKDVEIDLLKTTKDGDILTLEVVDQKNNVLETDEILITATAVTPGFILPKDLQ